MKFNEHSNLKGLHAFLGASTYSWLNYDEDKLVNRYNNLLAVQRGTDLHDFACRAIELGVRMPKSKKSLNMYVNDAIGYRMQPEQVLYYSENCFGTADTISFKNGLLRIHDLKTGQGKASMKQLMIYAAIFCLEYHVDPNEIEIELRIYQYDEIEVLRPEADDILRIMDTIVRFDKRLKQVKEEAG